MPQPLDKRRRHIGRQVNNAGLGFFVAQALACDAWALACAAPHEQPLITIRASDQPLLEWILSDIFDFLFETPPHVL